MSSNQKTSSGPQGAVKADAARKYSQTEIEEMSDYALRLYDSILVGEGRGRTKEMCALAAFDRARAFADVKRQLVQSGEIVEVSFQTTGGKATAPNLGRVNNPTPRQRVVQAYIEDGEQGQDRLAEIISEVEANLN